MSSNHKYIYMNLSAEQIAKVATNYVLLNSKEVQVLKVTKIAVNEYNTDIVNVRVINSVGKKYTTVVYLYQERDMLTADVDIFHSNNRPTISQLLEMDVQNPVFGTLEEEQKKIEDKKEEEAKQKAEKDFESKIVSLRTEYQYYQRRHQLGLFLRSLKKEGIQKLESYLPYQEGHVKANIEAAIKALQQQEIETGKKIEYNPGKRTVFYNAEIEAIIAMIEDSFSTYEEKVFEMAVQYLVQHDTNDSYRTIEEQAKDYVATQKSRLMCAVIRDLYDLKISNVETTSIRNEPNGFEGTWKLTLADNTVKYYHTRSIIAGGYIQRVHYRYITRLS